MTAVVLSGNAAASPIGGHATGHSLNATTITAPSVTLSHTDGTSAILHSYFSAVGSQWGSAPPSGYTQRQNSSWGMVLNTKNVTTSDGTCSETGGSSYVCSIAHTLEILGY